MIVLKFLKLLLRNYPGKPASPRKPRPTRGQFPAIGGKSSSTNEASMALAYGQFSKIGSLLWVLNIIRHLIFRVPKKGP